MNNFLKIRVTPEEYKAFQEICESKDKNMSEVLRKFIHFYTENKNVFYTSLDDETLKGSVEVCKEKKVSMNDLVTFLLQKAIKNKDKLNL